MYEKILARSFSYYEQRKLRHGAVLVGLLGAVTLCTVFTPYFGPFPIFDQSASLAQADNNKTLSPTSDENAGNGTSSIKQHLVDETRNTSSPLGLAHRLENITEKVHLHNQAENTTLVQGEIHGIMHSEVSCNFEFPRSDSCHIYGDVRVIGISGAIMVPETDPFVGNSSRTWKLRPYARKFDDRAMIKVREWSIKSVSNPQELPKCSVNHSVPAIIFSIGGYNGNHFHDFTDTLIPLFLSAKRFDGSVQFLVTDVKPWWLNKYSPILKKLSKYDIIDIDKEAITHCFSEVILGLISQKEFDTIPSMPPYLSLKNFTHFIRDAFSLPRSRAVDLSNNGSQKPSLMLISRNATRRLNNVDQVVKMAEGVGYNVLVAEGRSPSLSRFAETVNSCDVLLGIHGAGLTNVVFLPQNAGFIQIVPWGLKNLSDIDFGQPAVNMNLNYLEYQVTKEESSLVQRFPADHIVFRDPSSIETQSWVKFKAIYLDNQDITVDVERLKPLLVKTMERLSQL